MRGYAIIFILLASLGLVASPGAGSHEFADITVFNNMNQHYYASDEKCMINVYVHNTSGKNVAFTFYNGTGDTGDYLTFQPVVYDMQGKEAEIIVPYRLKNQSLADIMKRVKQRRITLVPGETFMHAIDLRSIYSLEPDTAYRVKSFFFPDITKKIVLRSSNELVFKIVEDTHKAVVSGVVRPRKRRVLEEYIAPSEVIMLHLNAEKMKEWHRFIKYIDISQFINSYSNYVRIYQLADDEEKIGIEEEFVNFLTRQRNDYILDYEILKEEVEKNGEIAYVEVAVERFAPRMTEAYKYRYTLEKEKKYWLITGLEATIMKGFKQ